MVENWTHHLPGVLTVRIIVTILLLSLFGSCLNFPRAMAIAPFHQAFKKKYVDREKNPEFYAKVKIAKCWLCHNYDPKEPKKHKKHNSYGLELVKLLDRKEDKKNKEKILKALDTVAAIHSKPDDKKSPTYGKLIAEGKYPGGKPKMKPKKK